MKKTILTTLAIAGIALSSFGQGVIYFDGSGNTGVGAGATTGGQVYIGGVLDTTQDINASLMMYNGTSYVPVVTLLLSLGTTTTTTVAFGSTQGAVGDITSFGGGGPFDVSGNGYQENFASYPSGSVGSFEVQGWTGAYSSYTAALAGAPGTFAGQTAAFNETLTSPTGTANTIGSMPALDMSPVSTPEPSVFALSSIGAAALMMFRRKK